VSLTLRGVSAATWNLYVERLLTDCVRDWLARSAAES